MRGIPAAGEEESVMVRAKAHHVEERIEGKIAQTRTHRSLHVLQCLSLCTLHVSFSPLNRGTVAIIPLMRKSLPPLPLISSGLFSSTNIDTRT